VRSHVFWDLVCYRGYFVNTANPQYAQRQFLRAKQIPRAIAEELTTACRSRLSTPQCRPLKMGVRVFVFSDGFEDADRKGDP
jgi:hypothetical protein